MLSILVNAYACSPHWGSEPGMGWNWIIALSKYCHLHIITEGEWKDEIEKALNKLPQKERIKFYYLPVSPYIREMCWNQGDWRFYYYYRGWQKHAFELATKIISETHIDIVHQLNMIGFREPGYLWKIQGVPFVWGPIGGMNLFPEKYMLNAGFKNCLKLELKNILNRIQMRFYPRVRKAVKRADALISATPESQYVFKKYYNKNSCLISETGCYLDDNIHADNRDYSDSTSTLNILWVGRFFYAKQLNIALETVSLLRHYNIRLHIVGEGNDSENIHYRSLASTYGIDDKCVWYGKIPHDRVFKLMHETDLFFFTSVSEATSTVVLEALQSNLPIVCFDTCGFGAVVNDKIGRKIPLSDSKTSAKDFANVIKDLYDNRSLLEMLSKNCKKEVELYSWDNKVKQVLDIYNQLIFKYDNKES